MIGSYGVKTMEMTGGGIINRKAGEELEAAAGGYVPNPKGDPVAEMTKKQKARERFYDRMARRKAAANQMAPIEEKKGIPYGLILVLAAVGLGAFFLFRRRK